MRHKQDEFLEALKGKKVPVLTLDNKWYKLFEAMSDDSTVRVLEQRLNELIKRQGKLNTESRDIRRLKKKLMNEIVPMVTEFGEHSSRELGDQIEDHKRLIAECNEKLDAYQVELAELPAQIEDVNSRLMQETLDYCYEKMQENTEQIREISGWVAEIRVELKKKLIRKQEMEIRNHNIYSYMHDIFGADVIDLFDMKYNPEEQKPSLPGKQEQ